MKESTRDIETPIESVREKSAEMVEERQGAGRTDQILIVRGSKSTKRCLTAASSRPTRPSSPSHPSFPLSLFPSAFVSASISFSRC